MVALIEARSAEALSLRTFSQAIGCREADLASAFRRQMGVGVRQYIARVRVECAASSIRRGEKVEAVALQVGYRSKKNFYKQFRRHFGVTPGIYRRQALHGHVQTC